jgi:Fe-S-cluster containining protein
MGRLPQQPVSPSEPIAVAQGRDISLEALDEIYALYDDFTKGIEVACRKGCCTCCTQDVTMTTLEGKRILRQLDNGGVKPFLKDAAFVADPFRFKPALTTNGVAACCLRGEDPPEEETGGAGGICQFLQDSQCTIYEARPFGCRCFFSTVPCSRNACALVDPFLLTINTLFLQCIEHVDQGGLFGNMHDVLAFLASVTGRTSAGACAGLHGMEAAKSADNAGSLPRNKPIPALMVPPEDRDKADPVVRRLKGILDGRFPTASNVT